MSLVRSAVDAMERWIFDDPNILIGLAKACLVACVAIVIVAAPFLWLAHRADEAAESRCLNSGAAWAITGHHMAPMLVGKVVVMHDVVDYGCIARP